MTTFIARLTHWLAIPAAATCACVTFWLAITQATAAHAAEGYAQESREASQASYVEEILVVGARAPRPILDVAGKVDVITGAQLANNMAANLNDALRYTPGVSTAVSSGRFGATELSMRGMSGNRVASLIDGVPIPDQFDIGEFANAGQDYLIPEAVSRIEILRGPASTLFGSDALGGVIAILHREPEEFLQGKLLDANASIGFNSRDDTANVTTSLAARQGRLAGVLHVSQADGHEQQQRSGVASDPLNRRRQSILLKTNLDFASGNRLSLSVSGFDEQVSSNMRAVLGYGRQYRNTTTLMGNDSRRRLSTGLAYEFSNSVVGAGALRLYSQRAEVTQRTLEHRRSVPSEIQINRSFRFDTEHHGLTFDTSSTFATGNLAHRLGWGLSLSQAKLKERRDGLLTQLATGSSSNVLLGEQLPLRDFPNSNVTEIGVYLYDELFFGPITIIPGLRFEAYDLDARADKIYQSNARRTSTTDVTEHSFSPKLGLLWHANARNTLYAQYAHGFRAPPFEDVNIGLDIPMFNIRAIPNPELRPEQSDGIEVGYRYTGSHIRWDIAVFSARYKDLIETKVNLGLDPATGSVLFQSRNVDRARVYGIDAALKADLHRWLPNVSILAAASWNRGENRSNRQPLNTIDPPELIGAIVWTPDDRMRFALTTTAVSKQTRVDESETDLTETNGYATVDLTSRFSIARSWSVDIGVFNLFDKQHWRWASIRNRPEGDPLIDLLAAPGRYASMTARLNF